MAVKRKDKAEERRQHLVTADKLIIHLNTAICHNYFSLTHLSEAPLLKRHSLCFLVKSNC